MGASLCSSLSSAWGVHGKKQCACGIDALNKHVRDSLTREAGGVATGSAAFNRKMNTLLGMYETKEI
jgi:hypothetical protein